MRRGVHKPPQTGPSILDAAVAAQGIQERRRDVRDPDLALFPDEGDLFGVIHYVLRRRRVPAAVLEQDVRAVFTIIEALRGEWERLTLAALTLAREELEAPIPWAELAKLMRVGTPQGAQQTYRRLASLLADPRVPGPRAERAAIEASREARAAQEALDALRTPLGAFLAALVPHVEALPEDIADDLLELRAKLHADEHVSGAAVSAARLLCDDLESLPPGQLPAEVASKVAAAVARLRAALPARRPAVSPAA